MERRFYSNRRLASDAKRGRVANQIRHRIQGRVQNALLVQLLKKNTQREIQIPIPV